MTSSPRVNPNVFANVPLERAAHRRTDPAWIEAALRGPGARIVVFDARRQVLAEEEPAFAVKWVKSDARAYFGAGAPPMFLGVKGDETYFALGVGKDFNPDAQPLGGKFSDLRFAANQLPRDDSAIAGLGAWLLDWHARNGFCAKCGGESEAVDSGWKRVCGACKTEHFPRVDPVAIMLATRGDTCLLGRQSMFPKGMYSALAGFVEPGETVEEACVRELLEESGIHAQAGNVRYLFAQPWPFPSSLMFGLHVEADSDAITVDPAELEEARWFTKAEVRAMCDGGLQTPDGPLFVPPGIAVARCLIDAWLAE